MKVPRSPLGENLVSTVVGRKVKSLLKLVRAELSGRVVTVLAEGHRFLLL